MLINDTPLVFMFSHRFCTILPWFFPEVLAPMFFADPMGAVVGKCPLRKKTLKGELSWWVSWSLKPTGIWVQWKTRALSILFGGLEEVWCEFDRCEWLWSCQKVRYESARNFISNNSWTYQKKIRRAFSAGVTKTLGGSAAVLTFTAGLPSAEAMTSRKLAALQWKEEFTFGKIWMCLEQPRIYKQYEIYYDYYYYYHH